LLHHKTLEACLKWSLITLSIVYRFS
jgi:hypothetical protein